MNPLQFQNQLSEHELDRMLFAHQQPSEPKPIRNLMDNYVIPSVGAAGGLAFSGLKSLANLDRKIPIKTLE